MPGAFEEGLVLRHQAKSSTMQTLVLPNPCDPADPERIDDEPALRRKVSFADDVG